MLTDSNVQCTAIYNNRAIWPTQGKNPQKLPEKDLIADPTDKDFKAAILMILNERKMRKSRQYLSQMEILIKNFLKSIILELKHAITNENFTRWNQRQKEKISGLLARAMEIIHSEEQKKEEK
uniref:Uncharacterized protein n=1 Tax=Myotis myotis TaxID=51298 RepID=A0A7J7R1J9_MYOMY|nr:hypothetical protein mMyoMyo1_011217 [Myotis myotis]